MLVEGALTTLRGYKASGITKVTILTCNDNHVCPQCAKLEGTVLTLKKAMEKLPIPNHCTSDDGCRCRYAAVVE